MPIYRAHVLVSGDPRSLAWGAEEVKATLEGELARFGLLDEVRVVLAGDLGQGDAVPAVAVHPDGVLYAPVTPADAPDIVEEHLLKGRPVERLRGLARPLTGVVARLPRREGPLFAQERIVLSDVGRVDPESITAYIAEDGYLALGRALTEMSPEEVVAEIERSGLVGRGGAGFPTGLKWRFVAQARGDQKHIICNADESEPGTFKDRLILEGDPHRALEAMTIAGYAVGATQGLIYIRGEYTLAWQRLERAIAQAHQLGLLGEGLFGTDFSFEVHVHAGAGAYICGEETALIESVEGRRGEPRLRPPYPTTHGLWGRPTVVNNVETLANVPPIIRNGADWYRRFGTERCPGTKVYTMLGHVNVTGLIEVPMGVTLREVVEVYAGGIKGGKAFKLAQTGGTAGSIVPVSMLDTPMDYPTMAEAGAALGSGALLICDEGTCVVDLARVLLNFFRRESCGKCVPCRIGTLRAYELLSRMADGAGTPDDVPYLARLADVLALSSFCGLGQSAAVPIQSALRHFDDEIKAHAEAKECPAGVCSMDRPSRVAAQTRQGRHVWQPRAGSRPALN